MSDPRWPSLREAARRFLRAEGCVLKVAQANISEAWNIVQSISDHIPERINLPRIEVGQLSVEGLFQIGGEEPDVSVCWVPNANFSDLKEQIYDLLEAGYPGCVGCGGPGSEGEWNEASRRSQFLD